MYLCYVNKKASERGNGTNLVAKVIYYKLLFLMQSASSKVQSKLG